VNKSTIELDLEELKKESKIKRIGPAQGGSWEVLEKYKNKCNVCKKTAAQLGVKLQVHHKDRNNRNPALSNLELLCPNHHYAKHGKGKNPKKRMHI